MKEEAQQKNVTHFRPTYLEVVVIAILVATGTIFAYDHFLAQKIYVFDLQGYLREQKAMLAAGELNETDWQKNLDALEQQLNLAGDNPHHIILLKDVVLRNGERIDLRKK